MSEQPFGDTAPLLLGDNLALDFINTEHGLGPLHREVPRSVRLGVLSLSNSTVVLRTVPASFKRCRTHTR